MYKSKHDAKSTLVPVHRNTDVNNSGMEFTGVREKLGEEFNSLLTLANRVKNNKIQIGEIGKEYYRLSLEGIQTETMTNGDAEKQFRYLVDMALFPK